MWTNLKLFAKNFFVYFKKNTIKYVCKMVVFYDFLPKVHPT